MNDIELLPDHHQPSAADSVPALSPQDPLMSATPTGSIDTKLLADGTRAFHLRFRVDGRRQREILHERAECECGCGGGWTARTARTELGNIRARIRAGVWRPNPAPAPAPKNRQSPTFHEYASLRLESKIDGVIGEKPIGPAAQSDYRWKLSVHLLPFFARYRLDEIDRELCLAFKSHKLAESARLRAEIAAGADIRDHRGRRAFPLGPASLRGILNALASILDDAIEDELIDRNPARGKRMRVRVPKPARTFLETDELVALIDAAHEQDVAFARPRAATIDPHSSRAAVAHLHAAGLKGTQIAAQLGLSDATVSYHLNRQQLKPVGEYVGRRAVVEILGRSGACAPASCADIRIGHVRLHDPDGARFRIPDAKTQAGIREVQMTPDLAETVIEHVDRLRRAGRDVGAEAHLVQNTRGGRMDRQRVGAIVHDAAELASKRHTARGLPPLPNTTPHSLRRTYISIALLANNFDVKWVMSQVGHADSKMTMDVYAQLEQRAQRSHGTAFDRILRTARETARGPRRTLNHPQPLGHDWATKRKSSRSRPSRAPSRRRKTTQMQGCNYGETQTRTGDTTIFSRVLYQLSYLAERASMLPAHALRSPAGQSARGSGSGVRRASISARRGSSHGGSATRRPSSASGAMTVKPGSSSAIS